MIAEHILDVQLFNGNDVEAIDQPPCCLVDEIMPSVTNTLMDARQNFVGLLAWLGTFLGFGLLPASLCQSLFIMSEEARVAYKLPIGQGQEGVQARVKANGISRRQQGRVFLFHREADEPFAPVSADGTGFDSAN